VGGVSSTDRLFLYLSAVWVVWKLSAIGNPKSLQNMKTGFQVSSFRAWRTYSKCDFTGIFGVTSGLVVIHPVDRTEVYCAGGVISKITVLVRSHRWDDGSKTSA